MKILLSTTIVLLAVSANVHCAKLLKNAPTRCVLKENESNECIRDALQYILKTYPDGIKEIGMLPFEPLLIPKMSVSDDNPLMKYNATHHDVKLYGFSHTKINSFRTDEHDKFTFVIEAATPKFRVTGNYNFAGVVMSTPLKGSGPYLAVFDDVRITQRIKADVYERKGQKYMRFVKYGANVTPGKVFTRLQNLFGDNKELEERMNQIFDENSEILAEAGKGPFEELYGIILSEYLNNVLKNVPLEQMFIVE